MTGNQVAQKILYDKYSKIVKNFILNKYSNNCDVDDNVSEIMIKVFLNLSSYDVTKAKFKSWVCSIANHYMIDKWRCNTISLTSNTASINYTSSIDSNSFVIDEKINDTLYPSHCYSSTCSTSFDNCNSINYISNRLSPQDFTFINMKYNYGYDYNEIGKEFNMSSTTISNRVNYIKTKLKKELPDLQYVE